MRILLFMIAAALSGTVAFAAPADPQLANGGAWLGKRDVPPGVLKRGERVAVGLTLTISPEGRPVACTVSRSSGYPLLDDHSCALFRQKATFEAARDAAGAAVGGRYQTILIWDADRTAPDLRTSKAEAARPAASAGMWVTTDDLPRGLLGPDDIVVSSLRLTISPAGRIAACTPEVPSRLPALDTLACQLMIARGAYRPARDEAGKPTEGVDWRRIRWQVPRG